MGRTVQAARLLTYDPSFDLLGQDFNMFSPAITRLEAILNSPYQFAIPLYQRDYKWGKEEALELIEDLRNFSDSDGERLFLGNIIFENTKDKKTFVVDGQQRLTTILLLLIACRRRALELKLDALAQTILGKITFVDSTTAESKGCRLIASESIRDVFTCIAMGSWDGKFPHVIGKKPVKRQVNRLRPIYDYFYGEVSQFNKEALSKFLGAIYDSYVIQIDIENEVDALSIFERTNARGMELEISDLLKNYLFSKKVEDIEEMWRQIVENSGGTILRMLKYFYVSKKGHVLKPQLYRKLKGYAAELGAQQVTKELLEFSRFYQVAKKADESVTKEFFEHLELPEIFAHQHRYQRINGALQALREFGVTQFCPPAYAAIECMVRNGETTKAQDAKKLIDLFEAFEKYHFINNAVCERVGNEVEKLYSDYCSEYAKASEFIKITDKLINELVSRLAKEDEFVANFTEIGYSQDQISFISYIFDRFNNFGLDPSQHIRIYNPDPKLLRRNHNIEHFLPQKPESELKVKKDTLEAVDNIGNLLPISYKTNSRLGNGSPAQKIARLKGDLSKEVQNLVYLNDFTVAYSVEAPSWDKKKIENRAKDMALKAFRGVWRIR
ncbi:MAG TPA: DUF262 domain-containing HNH endonuclease family protein [Verrucomicrobiae bacterium]|jgi:hypothetical protein|nr:DUF262 domain-containing HNH endonuclease family protein [Verrucomicrobiae bacterium]